MSAVLIYFLFCFIFIVLYLHTIYFNQPILMQAALRGLSGFKHMNPFLNMYFIFKLGVWSGVGYEHMSVALPEARRMSWMTPKELELQITVNHLKWMLGTVLRSPASATCALLFQVWSSISQPLPQPQMNPFWRKRPLLFPIFSVDGFHIYIIWSQISLRRNVEKKTG